MRRGVSVRTLLVWAQIQRPPKAAPLHVRAVFKRDGSPAMETVSWIPQLISSMALAKAREAVERGKSFSI